MAQYLFCYLKSALENVNIKYVSRQILQIKGLQLGVGDMAKISYHDFFFFKYHNSRFFFMLVLLFSK